MQRSTRLPAGRLALCAAGLLGTATGAAWAQDATLLRIPGKRPPDAVVTATDRHDAAEREAADRPPDRAEISDPPIAVKDHPPQKTGIRGMIDVESDSSAPALARPR